MAENNGILEFVRNVKHSSGPDDKDEVKVWKGDASKGLIIANTETYGFSNRSYHATCVVSPENIPRAVQVPARQLRRGVSHEHQERR
jgi:hypothetical protein